MEINYKLIYANRKTVSMKIEDDGSITVRAPKGVSKKEIEKILAKHSLKLEQMKKRVMAKESAMASVSKNELEKRLREVALPLVEKYSRLMGKSPSQIKFTDAKKRFGSCNSKGTICFSRYLALYPAPAIEYVVVHELSHLFEMNHSPRFHAIVEKYLPDWRERKKMIKLQE